ncbi:MerR family transcriptional regulator [Paenibacillus sp. GCM10027626]|uniref:MerR family transcriptional regulator n=1 Tax=Paenibacillus sp. GCM10027626 TaxID=3273411 RepID=UPI003642794E
MSGYFRGEIAKMANVNIETLRYYEELGLIIPPMRSASGYRLYSDETLGRLAFIQNAKACGFTLKEIRKALVKSESGEIDINDFLAVIDKKMGRIHAEIAKKEKTLNMLEQLKGNLQAADKNPEVRATLQILNME